MSEADTLRFVAKHTSIPVPRVQRTWCSNGITYIMIDFVRGVELVSVWDGMSQKTKCWVTDQLKCCLTAPGFASSSRNTRRLLCHRRLPEGFQSRWPQKFGPFQSHDDFHRFLRSDIPLDSFAAMVNLDGCREVVASHRQRYDTKFTHGDFAPRNILVKSDGTVTAIVDWDTAGWFPEYWEYTKANFTPYAPEDWVSSIGEMTGSYEEQQIGEEKLYDICGYLLT